MFTQTPKDKQRKGISPLSDHNYWKEIETNTNRIKTTAKEFSMIRDVKYHSHDKKPKNRQIFTNDLVHLFTTHINSKVHSDFMISYPKKVFRETAVKWTRNKNGGHIPDMNKTNFYDLFAKKSYIKPNQLKEDSDEMSLIIDNIKTDPRHTFSKKKELISLALKNT